jgi:hypothetical protein
VKTKKKMATNLFLQTTPYESGKINSPLFCYNIYNRLSNMNTSVLKTSITCLYVVWAVSAQAQPVLGEVSHWDDGMPMKCSYVFEQTPLDDWSLIDEPPVTVQAVNAIVTNWSKSNGLVNPAIRSYKLIPVRPSGHDYGKMVWFVEFIACDPKSGGMPVSTEDSTILAITMQGRVIEPRCDDQ